MENLEEMKDNIDWKTCPMEFTMNIIAGKWKLVILWHIYEGALQRYFT